jgi:hypothetical protein
MTGRGMIMDKDGFGLLDSGLELKRGESLLETRTLGQTYWIPGYCLFPNYHLEVEEMFLLGT